MPGVTISAGYGTGGSRVAQLVAEELQLPLLDRAISTEVAGQLNTTVDEATAAEFNRSLADRFFALLAPLSGGVLGAGTDAAPPEAFPAPDGADMFRRQTETIMRHELTTGAVILGRGGAAAFRDERDVLRVRLYGSRDGRIAHAARTQGVAVDVAEKRLVDVDTARALYVQRLFHVDIDNPDLYLLQLNSTVLTEQDCATIIANAYTGLRSGV